ncbi:TetR/AcrR family transcriptional regulator [Demequina sp. SYSU T00068]|uniref:TetR/AcrR family transcriptional regulator n=1 Tax=Demequina lignilytica TaxID=3051663 RepID=UPI00260C7B9D|nr:TetR/AcrR family transcriptional regulator [Demequina sp. SYSU T00068]MDN4489235.1 TetR/AcrR family transcriptional regulator [Demequina sp. SYSU T00068]
MSVDETDAVEPLSAAGKPLTKRGEATRTRLLESAEHVFAELGYHEASIVRITERAGIGLGTFYLYFDSKQAIFEALAIDLNRRVRHAMSDEMAGATTRIEAERAGFAGFFRFTAEHPALYRVVRESEYVSPGTMRLHYQRIVEGYEEGLRAAQAEGDVDPGLDPEVTAWTLMGIGELIGMRYLLWERPEGQVPRLPDGVFESVMRVVRNALAPGEERR